MATEHHVMKSWKVSSRCNKVLPVNKVSAVVADALAPCIAKSSAANVFTVQ